MAPWQLDLYLFRNTETLPDVSSDGWLPPALNGSALLEAQKILRTYLGKPWPIAERWFVFGPEEGSRADVIFENETSAAVVVRLDMRNDSVQFGALACRLANELGCHFFLPTLEAVIQPHPHALRFAMADATSVRSEELSEDSSALTWHVEPKNGK
ncbi:hypothetical protein GTP46_11390 [Duganella sp. FT135W]|uniref:Uncharacterized protein n=1 Tax=Duganella flavida TaxID=2692175 RepID=A0A6L8K6W4_9BURK|nr:hypothetical protein [Duganella flavida]MYM23249.1 hypothetical protein [Duganella flavida]